ncbi:MAG TPA: (2Fe-2S)-binding protein [Tepidisphaeraceae bacterium]|jgi:xanthine dehydrogenase YagT iron-sulfur-binding subunit
MQSNGEPKPQGPITGVSRRSFLKSVGATALAADALATTAAPAADAPAAAAADPDGIVRGETSIQLTINGQARTVTVEPRTTLLSALRDRLEPALTGPKLVCDAGTCGACTVILDGKTAYACSLLAIDLPGRQITTVEGLGTPDKLSPVQAAFCEKDAMMCGFCTSGFVTSVTSLLRANPDPTPEQIREGCKGNFCRCGTFPHIFAAATAAAETIKKTGVKA